MLKTLILINLFISMLWNSGAIEALDYFVSKKFPMRHLPQMFFCQLCLCWWTSLVAVIVTGNFSLLWVTAALANAHLTTITIPVFKIIEQKALDLIEKLIK